jgi:hypothetical protein
LEFLLELVLLHLAVVIVLGQMLIVFVDILQFLAEILDVFPHLSYLESELLVFCLLPLDLRAQFVAFQLQHRNQIIFNLNLRALCLLSHCSFRIFSYLGLFLFGKVLCLHKLFLQLKITLKFRKSVSFLLHWHLLGS